jgi:molybdenum cofactor biosynthesis enzyme MoaA
MATGIEYPRLVSIETTNRCNAKCVFCPNRSLARERAVMSDGLFQKILEDCRRFPLKAIEPFLNGEPFMDPRLIERLEMIRRMLPQTAVSLYSNGSLMTPDKIDRLVGLGVEHLIISVNTIDPEKYRQTTGLDFEKTKANLDYLTDPVRRSSVARRITFRITRQSDTTLAEQERFIAFARRRGVRPMIVGLFNYKGDVHSPYPVPGYPCEHITRLDILASGKVTLCCMDQEGEYSWGDVSSEGVLEVFNGVVASRYKEMHRSGKRRQIPPCGACNLFWPSLSKMPWTRTASFALQAGYYFLRHRPNGLKVPAEK